MTDNYSTNKQIINDITEYIENNKDIPFGAALYNTGILNIITHAAEFYYEKSVDIKKRMDKVKEKGHI